jgi:hypothetical protein
LPGSVISILLCAAPGVFAWGDFQPEPSLSQSNSIDIFEDNDAMVEIKASEKMPLGG